MRDVKYTIIIPAFNPDHKLLGLLEELKKEEIIHRIVVVNDGSKKESNNIFVAAQEEYGCILLSHEVNCGKGRALKTAYQYIREHKLDNEIIATADADGQHKPQDILRCLEAAKEHPAALVLGCRVFTNDDVPKKSRFGNESMRKLMKLFCGVSLSDTQTGLRAFSLNVMEKCEFIHGERFEYETNVLIYSKRLDIPIFEVPIETVYLEQNKSSHYRPIIDSLMILRLFFKYAASAAVSTVIDLTLFSVLEFILSRKLDMAVTIVISTIGARVISATVNFFTNQKVVFKDSNPHSVWRYAILCSVQMLTSAMGVYLLNRFMPIYPTILKMVVDTILFFINFYIQREWVFAKKKT